MSVQETKWQNQYKMWVKFYTDFNKTPSQLSENAEEKSLAHWQAYQRKQYKNRELSEERIELLQSTRGWYWQEEDAWEKARQNWVKQYEKLGENPPSSKSINPDEKVAGKWQSNQRYAYKNNLNIDELNSNITKWLTNERIKILEETRGWKWQGREENDSSDEEEVSRDRKRVRTF